MDHDLSRSVRIFLISSILLAGMIQIQHSAVGNEEEHAPRWWAGIPFWSGQTYQEGWMNAELVLGGIRIDRSSDPLSIPGWDLEDDSSLWILQFSAPPTSIHDPCWRAIDILSSDSILIELHDMDPDELRREKNIGDLIPYHPVYKLDPDLVRDIRNADGNGVFDIVAGLYKMPSQEEMKVFQGKDTILDLNSMLIHSSVDADDIKTISQQKWISHISNIDEIGPDNDIASDIIDVREVQNTLGLNGTDQIVAVCDTGLDTGLNSTMHPDFKGRIAATYAYGRTGNWSDPDIHVWDSSTGSWKYKGGHGTHVAGSVLGSGAASNGTYAGMAPAAKMVFQSTMTSTGSLSTPSYSRFLNDAFKNGARVHTNSWSSRSSYGNYTWRSWQTDNYLWKHKNLTVLFSAGNKGSLGTHSVSTQASAKNVIAVGASENYRPSISSWANNISEMAVFSSQGPTWGDYRIKPDVVAPGTYILSTRASTITDFWNHYWGSNSTYVGVNSRYAYMGGTSMSTPIVAGTAALIRQYYDDIEDHDDPTSALVKATLINGARPLNGKWSSIPNKYEGWGRVNLSNSLGTNDSDAGSMAFVDNTTGLSTGSNHTRLYTLSGGGSDLVITLVWTDYPGSNTSSTKLVNDLDLSVRSPNGTIYRGNGFIYSNTSKHDRRNNVERVLIESPPSGVYEVMVNGHSVTSGVQPYAMVLSGNLSGAGAELTWTSPFTSANGSDVGIELSDSNLTGDGWAHVTVNSTSDVTGEVINLTEVKLDGKGIGLFRGSVRVVTSTPGSGEVLVTGDQLVTAHYDEDYPSRSISRSIMAYVPADIHSTTHDADGVILTYLDKVVVEIKGTSGWDAHLDVVGLGSRQDIQARDDGILPDLAAGDGTYTAEFTIPNLIVGNFTLRGTITRTFLPPTTKDSDTQIVVNTNYPRRPIGLQAEPVLSGNRIKLTWEDPGDLNLMSYQVYSAVETFTGSGIPADPVLVHSTPDNRTVYTDVDLVDGTLYFYRVRSMNVLGFLSEPTGWVSSVPRDETPPWIELDDPGGPIMASGNFVLDHTVEDDAVEIEYQGALDTNGDLNPDSEWQTLGIDLSPEDPFPWDTTTIFAPLVESRRIIIRAIIEDEAANSNISEPLITVIVDNTAPGQLTIFSPLTSAINVSVHPLTGRTEASSSVVVLKDGERYIEGNADGSGDFQIYVPLEEGINLFKVECYDHLGNGPLIHEDELLVVFDPYVPESRPAVTNAITSSSVVFDGTGSNFLGPDSPLSGLINFTWNVETAEGSVVLYGEVVDLSISIPGLYEATLTVIDSAMNHAVNSTSFIVIDTTYPEVAGIDDKIMIEDTELSLIAPFISDNDPRIVEMGTFTWVITGPENRTLKGNDISWTFKTPGLYNCTLIVTDTGGNNATTSFAITVLDRTSPVPYAGSDIMVMRGMHVNLDASGSSDNDPLFPKGANFTWFVVESERFYYGARVNISFYELGEHTIRLKVADASGNVEHDELIVDVNTDGVPPVVLYTNIVDDPLNLTPSSDLRFQFSEEMDQGTFFGSIRLIGPDGTDLLIVVDPIDLRIIEVDPVNELRMDEVHILILERTITDITGERLQRIEIEFTVHERIRLLEIDGETSYILNGGDIGEVTIPITIDVYHSGNVDGDPVVMIRNSAGEEFDVTATNDPVNSRVSISIVDELPPGEYEVLLELMDPLGREIEGIDTLSFTIPSSAEEGGSKEGNPWLLFLIIGILLIMAIIGSVLLIMIRRRSISTTGEDRDGSDHSRPSYGQERSVHENRGPQDMEFR